MVLNLLVAAIVCKFTPAPPQDVQEMIEEIRVRRGAGAGVNVEAAQSH